MSLQESLANERNGLAWQRSALAWGASGAAIVRYFASGGLLTSQTVVGWMMLAVGAVMWADSTRRYHRNDQAIRSDGPPEIALAAIRSTWIMTVVVIATAIAVEIRS